MLEHLKSIKVRRGLRNLGNTCFFNSVIQAISSCPSFENYLNELVNRNKTIRFTRKLLLCMHEIRSSNTSYPYNPNDLFHDLIRYNQSFKGNQQQDALELFQALSNLINKENHSKSLLFNNKLGLYTYSDDNSINQKIITNHIKLSNNPFEGLIASEVVCQSCKMCRPVKHESFVSLSLPIPNKSSITMYDCINNYLATETIDNVECPSCSYQSTLNDLEIEKIRTETELYHKQIDTKDDELVNELYYNKLSIQILKNLYLTSQNDKYIVDLLDDSIDRYIQTSINDKQISLTDISNYIQNSLQKVYSSIDKHIYLSRLPSLLCIHLCRKVYNKLGELVKNNSFIRFSNSLDMSSFSNIHRKANTELVNDFIYNLKAVIVHDGNAYGGHYYAYCLSSDESSRRWLYISDSHTKTVDESTVLNSNAYMLFYEKSNDS